MQYSPKLKKVIEQIKDILKENDIAGFVLLHTPGYSEYLNHTETSYSCITNTPDGMRLQLKTEEVGEKKAEILAHGTYNMVVHFSKILTLHANAYSGYHTVLKQRWDGTDGPGNHSSHNQQNN